MLNSDRDRSIVRTALENLISDLDYDLHKGIEHGEEDGKNHYEEVVDDFFFYLIRADMDELDLR